MKSCHEFKHVVENKRCIITPALHKNSIQMSVGYISGHDNLNGVGPVKNSRGTLFE